MAIHSGEGQSGVHVAAAVGSEGAKRQVPPQIQEHLLRWGRMGNRLRTLQICLAVTGTTAALAVTTFTGEIGDLYTKVLSFTAALSISLMTGFNVGGKADSIRNAWRRLNAASMLYRSDQLDLVALVRTYEQAEALVGDVPFNEPRSLSGRFREDEQPAPARTNGATRSDKSSPGATT